jgi:acetyltransferase-like isoleucine patch superfamily enzyme
VERSPLNYQVKPNLNTNSNQILTVISPTSNTLLTIIIGRRDKNMSKLLIADFLLQWFRDTKDRIHSYFYNDETISNRFRKQGARIGKNCRIQIRWLASEPYLVNIGDHVCITSGVGLHTHDGGVWILREKDPMIHVFGPITIEDNCIIGIRAQILPNVCIGRNSIVGAGSVVITDVPPNSIVMGIPARVIGSTVKYEEKCLAAWKKQKPPDLLPNKGHPFWAFDKENLRKVKKHLLKLSQEKAKSKEKTGEKTE